MPESGTCTRGDVGNHPGEGVHDLGLADEAEGGDVIARAPGADGLEPRALPHGQGPGHEDVLGAPAREVPGELAERPLRLAHAGQDLPLDDDLGGGGDVQVDGRARRDLERLAEEPTDHLELADVRGRIGERSHGDERMEAERDGAGQRLAPGLRAALVLEHPATRVEADAQAIGAA